MKPFTPSVVAADLAPMSERPACVIQAYAAEPLQTEGELFALGFNVEGKLCSLEEPGLLRRWDLNTSRQTGKVLVEEVSPLWCFGPGCKVIATASDEVTLFDAVTSKMLVGFSGLPWVTALAFSANGKLLATGHDDGSIRLWDL